MRYRIDVGRSRFTVHATSGGMLSMLAHNPTFAVREFAGELRWQPDAAGNLGFDMTIRADSLKLTDEVRPVDRDEVEGRMRREVLEVTIFPEIAYRANKIETIAGTENRYRLRFLGALALHGVANPLPIDADLIRYDDGVRMQGEASVRMSAFKIRPVTALGGAIQLRDALKLAFDLVAWQEA
jgi:polyisoprenoid-binding protein YceI